MALGRGAFAELLGRDLRRVFVEVGKQRAYEYPMVFNVDDMEANPVTDRNISGLGTMPSKPEGARFILDEPISGNPKSYEAVPYGLGYEVTWEMWRDDQYGLMREEARLLERSSHHRLEADAWGLFNNGFNTAFTGFTPGEALFSTAHARLDGGASQANRPNPDVSLSQTAIQNALIAFETLVDERGMPSVQGPAMLIIPPQLKWVAREILGSQMKPYTSDNEVNVLIEEDLSWMVGHYLTSSTAWFMVTNKDGHDLNFLIRDYPIFDGFDDSHTKNAVYTAYQRHIGGWGSWKGTYGSTG